MRKTDEELRTTYPWKSHMFDNISAVMYGDIPFERHNEEWYKSTVKITEDNNMISDLFAVDHWIYKMIGDHDVYETEHGKFGIKDGEVIYGDFSIHYGGYVYDTLFNNIYIDNELMKNSLTIMSIRTDEVSGWRNKTGQNSPSLRNKKLDDDKIEKVLSSKWLQDFGYGVQVYIDTIKKIYESDKTNYFMVQIKG